MLRALAFASARRHFATNIPSSPPRSSLHQPLGSVPKSADPEAVRGKWGSNAMDLIQQTEPIKVSGNVVACNGGGGSLGHPIEYIKLEGEVGVCKYCGLKYVGDGTGGH